VLKADNLPSSCVIVTKSGNLNFLEPSGHLRPVMGLLYLYIIFYLRLTDVYGHFFMTQLVRTIGARMYSHTYVSLRVKFMLF